MKTKIILETPDILVCEKPAGLAVQTASGFQADMASELKNYLSRKSGRKNPYLGLVHRLDQPVEGLMAVAVTKAAASDLSMRLANGGLKKKYMAVLEGIPAEKQGTLIHKLGRDGRTGQAYVCGEQETDGKPAKLTYRILAERDSRSLAEIEIATGRFHQIRVQMAQIGCPVAGDARYGRQIRSGENLALCAYLLEFYDKYAKTERRFVMKPENTVFDRFAEYVAVLTATE